MTETPAASITLTEPLLSPGTKRMLVPECRRLVELMQQIGYGRIEDLHVRAGLPTFDPPPRVIRDHKFGACGHGPTPQSRRQDFAIKQQVRELLEQIGAIGEGVIERLEVQGGLPFRMSFAEPFPG